MISAYFKPTNFCNVGCDHCYLSEAIRSDKLVMSYDQLGKACGFITDLCKSQNTKQAMIIWHGGEPMSLPPSWYIDANSILKDRFSDITYSETMQTSLIPYTSKWSELVHDRFQSHLGSSIDFSQRKVKGSPNKYIELWLNKVELARSDGIDITPGMVPTKGEIKSAKKIYNFFKSNSFGFFNIDRYSAFSFKPIDWPSNRETSEFMKELLDAVISDLVANKPGIFINVIMAAIRGVAYSLPGDRWGTTCQSDFLVIEPNGNLNTCPDRVTLEKTIGNMNEGVKSFEESPQRRKWIRINTVSHKRDHCYECEYASWCKSACPNLPNGPSDGESECSGYKTFLNVVKDKLQDPVIGPLLIGYSNLNGHLS